MTKQTIVLTGATDGLGRALAERLAAREDTLLILHGRSAERLALVEDELRGQAAQIKTVLADFSDLRQVRLAAEEIGTLTDQVSLLINNAGFGGGSERQVSADGHELVLAVNHLAPFTLTDAVLPLLEDGAPSRVVNVASLGQEPIDADDLGFEEDYKPHSAYARSKFVMITTGLALARRLDPARVTVNSIHPASMMPTKMVAAAGMPPRDSLESGVDALYYVATDPSLAGVSGQFFNGSTPARAREEAYDEARQERLWDATVALTSATSPAS